MHARIATVRVRPGSADEARRAWQDLLPAYRETGVFRGLVSVVTEDDVVSTLTLWESAEAADEVAPALRARAAAAFADIMVEAPTITAHEVLLTTTVDELAPPAPD